MRADKQRLLSDAGYIYHFDRQMYLDRRAKKAFSIEFVDDHDEKELRERILEAKAGDGWSFYFSSPPSGAAQKELERVLG
jgi:hypothetical protein